MKQKKCIKCNKKLHSDNSTGYCHTHVHLSEKQKQFSRNWKEKNHKAYLESQRKYEKEKRDGDLNILYSELLTRELPAIRNLYMLECF